MKSFYYVFSRNEMAEIYIKKKPLFSFSLIEEREIKNKINFRYKIIANVSIFISNIFIVKYLDKKILIHFKPIKKII